MSDFNAHKLVKRIPRKVEEYSKLIRDHPPAYHSSKFDINRNKLAGDIWKHMKIIIPPLFCGQRPFLVSIQTQAMRKNNEIIIISVKSTYLFAKQTQDILDTMSIDEVAMILAATGKGYMKGEDGSWGLRDGAHSCYLARVSKEIGVYEDEQEAAVYMLKSLKYAFPESGMKIISKMLLSQQSSTMAAQVAVAAHINSMMVHVEDRGENIVITAPKLIGSKRIKNDKGEDEDIEIFEKCDDNDKLSIWNLAGLFGAFITCAAASEYPRPPAIPDDATEEYVETENQVYYSNLVEVIESTYLVYRNILCSPPTVKDDPSTWENCARFILGNNDYDTIMRLPFVNLIEGKHDNSLYKLVGTTDIRPTQFGWTTLHKTAGRRNKANRNITLSDFILEELQRIIDTNRNNSGVDQAQSGVEAVDGGEVGFSAENIAYCMSKLIFFFESVRTQNGGDINKEIEMIESEIMDMTAEINCLAEIIDLIYHSINIDYSNRRNFIPASITLESLSSYIIRLGSGRSNI